jgi:hypothetical protein
MYMCSHVGKLVVLGKVKFLYTPEKAQLITWVPAKYLYL